MRDWLAAHRVTQVTMEATGVYWKPVWAVLEDEFELLLASWAGQCSGNDQSAGKRRSGKTRNGSKWFDWTLEESALAAIRSDTYLAALYARLKPRRGHKKALGAVKHSIICACWHMLSTGELYADLGGDYFRKRDPSVPPNA